MLQSGRQSLAAGEWGGGAGRFRPSLGEDPERAEALEGLGFGMGDPLNVYLIARNQ
jgi:hypothetical protein